MDTSDTNRSITTSNDDTSKYNKCSTASNNRDTNNSWNNTATNTNSRSKYITSSTDKYITSAADNCWPTNGNSTNKSNKKTTTANAKREQPDEITQGSEPKQQRTTEQQQPIQRPEQVEPPTTRMRINAIQVTTKRGETITTTTCEDEQEVELEKILLEPMVHNTEGLDKKKTVEGMKHEVEQMKKQGVYSEVNINDLTPEQQATIIESRWVLRDKGDKVRARIVAKGYTEQTEDANTIYASAAIFCILRILLTMAMAKQWTVKAGDISVAFLHANAATKDLYMWPPQEFYNDSWQTVWRLHKAMYGLRSSPPAWQNHLAQILQDLNMTRLKSEPNVYKTSNGALFSAIQKQLLLRPTGELSIEQTISFLGRDITNKGDHYEISLSKGYTATMLEEAGMTTCKAATTPGTAANKTSDDHNDNIPVDKEEHALYRRIVGKLQWMTYTRPDLSFATKELARSLQQPNIPGHEENEAYTTVSTRNKGLQVHTSPDDNSGRRRHTNTRRLRRCGLGRLHNNKKIHNRIRNQIPWINNPFRIKDTSNRSAVKCRIRTIRNWNRSTRSTTHPKFPDGDNPDKQITNSDPHGLNKRKEHCNKNRIVKEGKTHWLEVPFSYSNWYTTAYYQCTRSVPWTTLQTYSPNLSQQKSSTSTCTTLGFWAQTTTSAKQSRQFHKLASKQFHIHINKRDACTIHTSVVDAMVSQSYMDTISTISFWTLTIRRFTGWWWQWMSQFRFLHEKWTIWFSQIFAVQGVKFSTIVERDNSFRMKQFCCMNQCVWRQSFVCRRSNFRWENNCGDNHFFSYKVKTMACDMPNFDEKIDNVDYKSLRLLGHGATISHVKSRSWGDQQLEMTMKWRTRRSLIYKMGDNVTFLLLYNEGVWDNGEKRPEVQSRISLVMCGQPMVGCRQLDYLQSKTLQTNWCGTWARITLPQQRISRWLLYTLPGPVQLHEPPCNKKGEYLSERGYSMQMVHSPPGTQLCADQVRAGQYNRVVLPWLQCAPISTKIYHGLMGSFGPTVLPINVANALDAKDNNPENPVLTASAQGIHNGGNHALKESPTAIRDRVVEYYVSTNSPLLSSNLLPEENLGRPRTT